MNLLYIQVVGQVDPTRTTTVTPYLYPTNCPFPVVGNHYPVPYLSGHVAAPDTTYTKQAF